MQRPQADFTSALAALVIGSGIKQESDLSLRQPETSKIIHFSAQKITIAAHKLMAEHRSRDRLCIRHRYKNDNKSIFLFHFRQIAA